MKTFVPGSRARRARFAPPSFKLAVTQLEDRSVPAALPTGPQFTVTPVTGSEAGPSVVAVVDTAGDFVAAWESLETDGSGIGVYTQAFLADGTPVGTAVLVNQTTAGNQSRPAIATDGNGNVVFVWQGEAGTGGAYDIYSRLGLFTGGGTPSFALTTAEAVVNATTAGSQTSPTAAMDANGNFVIAWQSDQDLGTTGLDVYGRFGTLAGGLLGAADTAVSAAAGDQVSPVAAMAATGTPGAGDGQIVVAWTGATVVAGETTNVVRGTLYAYDAAFTTIAPTDAGHTDYQLTAAAQHDQVDPAVAMAPDGRFVLVWQAEGQQGSGSDIFARRFDANGDGLDGADVLVNTVTSEPQRAPAVGVDASGNYFVAWQSQGADTRSWGIVSRGFSASGSESRADFVVNVNGQGPQTNPAVAVAPNGNTVAVWSGPFVPSHGGEGEDGVEGEGGHQPALFARLFGAAGTTDVAPAGTATSVNGLEFQLATVGAGEDVPNGAAVLSDGTYVVVWQAFEEAGDVSGYGIYGQRLTASGTPIGAQFLINQTTLGYQSNPSVAALPSGGFVVVWQNETRTAALYDIYGRVYAVDGMGALVAGNEFLVNENSQTGQQGKPAVASDATGNVVVVWQTDAQLASPAEDLTEIYARRYSTSGTAATALAPEFRVNTQTATAQVAPQVAMNAAGQFAVVWVSDHNVANDATDTEKSVFVRWYGADGVAPNPEFLASVYTKDAQEHPEIGIDAAGDLVVAWQSINQATGTGVSWDVYARQFHPDGTSPQTQEFQVNETVTAPQRFPAVGVDDAGRFAIAWQAINQDGSSWAVFQRQYRADGSPDTGEQIANTVTSGPQILPVYARGARGSYDLFWSGGMADHVDGIGGRPFGISAVPGGPQLNGPGGPRSGRERSPIALPISIAATDLDVAETLSVVITGVPDDATLSAGTKQPDGSWVLTPAQLTGLTIRPAHEETFTLTVSGIATETKTGRQATTAVTVTVTAQNVDSMVVGAGGGSAVVTQIALDGSPMRSIDAFAGFAGGVTVATGDVTGDGIPDIVVGAGAGAVGGHVKVFDGDTGALVRSFLTFDGYMGGVAVATGDVTGDGIADIVVGAGAGAMGGHVKVFDGDTGALVRSFLTFDGYMGGVTVAAGDLDGDGYAEVVVGTATGSSHVKVFDGATGAVVRSFLVFDAFAGGVTVAAGDETGDGFADIVVGAGPGAGPHVKLFDGRTGAETHSYYTFERGFAGGVRVAAKDANGDGIAELFFGPGPGGGPHMLVTDPDTGETLLSNWAFAASASGGIWVG